MEPETRIALVAYILFTFIIGWLLGRWAERNKRKPFTAVSKKLKRPFYLHEVEGILKGSKKHYNIYYFSEVIDWSRVEYEMPEDYDIIEAKTGLPMLKRQIGPEK
jgi:hypothetical protein